MKKELIILPRFVDDALKNNYIGIGLAKNVRILSDILSLQDLSFYILINEPNYLCSLFSIKLEEYEQKNKIKLSNSKEIVDAMKTSFIQTPFTITDPELSAEIEKRRLEMKSISIEDLFLMLGSNNVGDNPFVVFNCVGYEPETIAVRPEFISDSEAINQTLGSLISSLMNINPLDILAKTDLFKVWEGSYVSRYL